MPRQAAIHRAELARAGLAACRWCIHDCGADRRRSPAGRCRAGPQARIFHRGIEWAGEADLVPTAVVSFSGCPLRCGFCLTGRDSQDADAGEPDDAAATARWLAGLPQVRSLTILGGEPVVHLPAALELIAALPADLPVVWKTAGILSPAAMELLDGVVDRILLDAKFGDDACARRLAGCDGYADALAANLAWAAPRGLIVRHLVMPGHVACCTAPALDLVRRVAPQAAVSLMTGFLPAFRSAAVGMGRTLDPAEIDAARAALAASGLAAAPWAAHVPPADAPQPAEDELWLDPQGRILADSASPRLLAALRGIGRELTLDS